MRPSDIISVDPAAFRSETSCLGDQLVRLLHAVRAARPDIKWYVADVQTVGPSPVARRQPEPVLIGATESLIQVAQRVEQFESGVFAGVSSTIEQPAFRCGGLWTDDEAYADLGDAIIEIRAFDMSYWSIATSDADLTNRILVRLEEGTTKGPAR
jgi:hypothetical protein